MAQDLSYLKTAKINPNEPHMRLLVCKKCKNIDEVPQYEGPEGGENSADYDFTMRFFVDQHIDKGCKRDDFITYILPTKYWIVPKVKESIIKQINEGAQGLDVFGTNFYATKDNFTSDAMTCWTREHKSTKDCNDYKSEIKVLSAGTEAERKSGGFGAYKGKKVYLCDFCPVKSIVQGKYVKKMGLDK
jgi:hypothetical protein